MSRLLIFTVLWLTTTLALAAAPPTPDLMDSAGCQLARKQFDAAFDAASDRSPDTLAQLDAARSRAARACFGAASATPTGPRSPQPTVVTPQAATLPGNKPLMAPPVTAAPQAPVTIPRPATIGNCDAAGCWGSDGSRLNRVGPELNGPRGACVVQGTFVNCP